MLHRFFVFVVVLGFCLTFAVGQSVECYGNPCPANTALCQKHESMTKDFEFRKTVVKCYNPSGNLLTQYNVVNSPVGGTKDLPKTSFEIIHPNVIREFTVEGLNVKPLEKIK